MKFEILEEEKEEVEVESIAYFFLGSDETGIKLCYSNSKKKGEYVTLLKVRLNGTLLRYHGIDMPDNSLPDFQRNKEGRIRIDED